MEQETDNMSNMEQETEMPKLELESDIPKLIERVKEHICIWDMQAEEYYNKKMYRAAWKSLVPLEDPEKPLDAQNKLKQRKKIADLMDIWVDLRNSYFRNEEPGKTYKDSLRFLDCVYQSREIEDILEFDEPSWDLMDVRAWNVKQSQIPKAERRYTDPDPDYTKQIKRPRLGLKDKNKTDKDKETDKDNKDKETDKDTGKDTDKETGKDNDIYIDEYTGQNTDKGTNKDTDMDMNTDRDIDTDIDTDKDTNKGIDNDTDKDTDTDNDRETDKDTGTDKVNDTNKVKETDKEKDTNKNQENKTAEKKKKRSTKKLTILEKAMALYEIENPGVWDSDEDEPADKESRTYTEVSTQTDE